MAASWRWDNAFSPFWDQYQTDNWIIEEKILIPQGDSVQRVIVHGFPCWFQGYYQDPAGPVQAPAAYRWTWGISIEDTVNSVQMRKYQYFLGEVQASDATVSGQQQVNLLWQPEPGWIDTDMDLHHKALGTSCFLVLHLDAAIATDNTAGTPYSKTGLQPSAWYRQVLLSSTD